MILSLNSPLTTISANAALHCGPSRMHRPSFIGSRLAEVRPPITAWATHLRPFTPSAYSNYRRAGRIHVPKLYAALSTAPAVEQEVKTEESDQVSITTPVVLTVRNMKCGGCSAAVKRMLLQQPGISSAAVNLLTETAVVRVVGNAPEELAEQAATVLGTKGFPAELRKPDEDDLNSSAAAINERKAEELKES